MGVWNRLSKIMRLEGLPPAQTFHEPASMPVDQAFRALHLGYPGRVTREEALSVSTVQKGRNLICSVGTLPLVQKDFDNRLMRSPFLEQIDPDFANVVTMTNTVEDLLFEAVAWWRVTSRGWDGYPLTAQRYEPGKVTFNEGDDHVFMDGVRVSNRDVIKFVSPNPAVLRVGARAIRRAIALDKAASMYATDPSAREYFTPTDGADPVEDDEIEEILDGWRDGSAVRYVPASLQHNTVNMTAPRDLQLVELQRQANLDIANAMGVDPEELGVSTTSRTYANINDRRQDKINEVLSGYMRAITDRLSMGDVTKRGQKVSFDLSDYMKSNPTERFAMYEKGKALGVWDTNDIRRMEGEPPMEPTEEEPAAPVLEIVPDSVSASQRAAHNFDGPSLYTFSFSAPSPEFAFSVDGEKRTIFGLALPFGQVVSKYGKKFRFHPGGARFADVSRVKHFKDHATPVGKALELHETPAGMTAKLSVGRGPTGDELLQLAEDGIYDGLSVGVDFSEDPRAGDVRLAKDGVYDVVGYDLREITTTAMPAFDNARVTHVAASLQGGEMEKCATCGTEHAPGVACPTTTPPAVQPGQTVQLSADQFTQLVQQMQPTPQVAPEGPTVVSATRPVTTLSVNEGASYRFDREGNLQPAKHDFGMDVIAAIKNHDPAANQRVMEFVNAQFDVASGDVNELNPTINMPRYVDQREFNNAVWNTINKGAPPNGIQPFAWPKFNSASGLVGAHTEGSEPSSGTLTTTNQTVTPAPISGKAKITRETWDMGGTPGVGGLLWNQMKRGWYESLEAKAIAVLDAATPTAIALTAGGGTTGQLMSRELRAAFAALHFVRGGWRFTDGFAQIDFYKALVGAEDDTGRPLYPAIGPTNADGTVANRYQSVNVNGVPFLPSWALAASGSVVASSYLFDRDAVDGWVTQPQELRMLEIEVAHVYVGIWGYAATAINDLTGVREITYDPVP